MKLNPIREREEARKRREQREREFLDETVEQMFPGHREGAAGED